jgi:hypothetical protein
MAYFVVFAWLSVLPLYQNKKSSQTHDACKLYTWFGYRHIAADKTYQAIYGL